MSPPSDVKTYKTGLEEAALMLEASARDIAARAASEHRNQNTTAAIVLNKQAELLNVHAKRIRALKVKA